MRREAHNFVLLHIYLRQVPSFIVDIQSNVRQSKKRAYSQLLSRTVYFDTSPIEHRRGVDFRGAEAMFLHI